MPAAEIITCFMENIISIAGGAFIVREFGLTLFDEKIYNYMFRNLHEVYWTWQESLKCLLVEMPMTPPSPNSKNKGTNLKEYLNSYNT